MSTLSTALQTSASTRKVTLEDVNTSAQPAPIALARDPAGSQLVIDLTVIPVGLASVPEVGQVWWVEHRTTRWTLIKLADDMSMQDQVPGASLGVVADMQALSWMQKL